jgi:hypothetical protein
MGGQYFQALIAKQVQFVIDQHGRDIVSFGSYQKAVDKAQRSTGRGQRNHQKSLIKLAAMICACLDRLMDLRMI